jgi:hypothetical protein
MNFQIHELVIFNQTTKIDTHEEKYFHSIPIPWQPVFTPTSHCCMLSREATNSYFIVFGLMRPRTHIQLHMRRAHQPTDAFSSSW